MARRRKAENALASISRLGTLLIAVLTSLLGSEALSDTEERTRAASVEQIWKIPSNDRIAKLLTQRLKHNGVGIVVGVIDSSGPRVVARGRAGKDDLSLDGDTLFYIGSITKVFTTLLLADMVERGEVDLRESISKYLPRDVVLTERARMITLLDLATHYSGLPSMPTNFDLAALPNPYEAYSVSDLYAFLSEYEPRDQAGEKHEYSNLGVALLGRLLAQRVGAEYEELLKERVLTPLQLRDTSIAVEGPRLRRLAQGYDRYLNPVDVWELPTLLGSGSLRSSANDLLSLLAHYLQLRDSPLSAAMARQTSVRRPIDNGAQALGWIARTVGGEELLLHEGGKEGYRAVVAFSVKRRAGIVVLTNARTEDEPGLLAQHLLVGRTLDSPPDAPKKRTLVSVERAVLESYEGIYRIDDDQRFVVARKDDYLLVNEVGGGIGTFFAQSPTEFYLNTGNYEIAFRKDAARAHAMILKSASGDADKVAIRIR